MDTDEPAHAPPRLEIETPSWGYGNSGTRFHVYPWPGAARDVWERITDAALVHGLTGCCPSVALHVPWDRVDDWSGLRRFARARRAARGDQPELLRRRRVPPGQPLQPRRHRSARALDHCLECVAIARGWFADHQPLARGRHELSGPGRPPGRYARCSARPRGGLRRASDPGMRLLVEYKFFEPGFYSTDLPDWGTAALVCRRLGPQAQVLVDTGHHPQGTNVEQIVASSSRRGSRRLPLQQPQVRRRRPDRGRNRPVRALPDHARDRPRSGRSVNRRDRRGSRS